MDASIPIQNLTAIGIAAFCTTLLPIIIVVILGVKRKISLKPFFVGALAFFISQVILRIPIMTVLSANSSEYRAFVSTTIGLIVVGGFTAGLFEETARLVGGKFFLKNKTAYKDAVTFGLGHGLCEVIVLVGLPNFNLFLSAVLVNSGMFPTQNLPAGTVDQLIQTITGYTIGTAGIVVLERISSVAYHIFATVLIFKGINERKIRYYYLAILAHTILNSTSVLVSNTFGLVASEGVLLILAAACTVYTVKVKEKYPLRVDITRKESLV